MRRLTVALATTVAATCLLAGTARASFHENLISEVHQGVADVGDYVELQAYSAGQNLVGSHYIVTYDGGSNAFSTYQLPTNVANGANQATILVANDVTVAGADFNSAGN